MKSIFRAFKGPFKGLYTPFKGLIGRCCTLFYDIYIYIYIYIYRFGGAGEVGGIGDGGRVLSVFNRFSTEELRLATVASAPVARICCLVKYKKYIVAYMFLFVLYRFYTGVYTFSTEEVRLATGAGAPVARKKQM